MNTLADGAYVWLGSALLFGALIYFRGPVRLRVEDVENVPRFECPCPWCNESKSAMEVAAQL